MVLEVVERAFEPTGWPAYSSHRPRHDDRIRSFCLSYDRPLDWAELAEAIQGLIDAHGGGMLRIKGILNIQGRGFPTVIHGIQHIFHPPMLLDAWPDADRRPRLVFITRDIDKKTVLRALSVLT